MPENSIGLFAYAAPPDEIMPERRTRAMLAEGLYQDVDLLLFSAADCDPESGLITARRWRKARFETVRVPLPPLVVIISDPMRDGHRQIGDWIRARTAVLDDHAPDKLAQVELLSRSHLAAHAIPAEAAAADRLAAQIVDGVARWGAVVVKPVNGMRGFNVHFLRPTEAGRFELRSGADAIEGSLPEMAEALRAKVAARLGYRGFMIQQFVSSTYRGMLLSLRVDVGKMPDGEWRTTRPVVRIGLDPGALVSNYASGTAQADWDRFFAKSGLDPAIGREAERIAREAAALVDGHPDGAIIEAGVDLARTADGSLKVIEVNARLESTTWEHVRATHVIAYYRALVERLSGRSPPAGDPPAA